MDEKQNRQVKYFFTSTLIHKFCAYSAANPVSQVSSKFSPFKYITPIRPWNIHENQFADVFFRLFRSERFFEPVIIFCTFLISLLTLQDDEISTESAHTCTRPNSFFLQYSHIGLSLIHISEPTRPY